MTTAILAEKTRIGFDLNDTIHEFRHSSGIATDKVLAEISKRHGTPIRALKDEYFTVLKMKTANAFSDGKISFDCRRERFASNPTHFSLPLNDQFMYELFELYDASLMASLGLKFGTLDLLLMIKNMGKKIVSHQKAHRTHKGERFDGLVLRDISTFSPLPPILG